MTPTEHLDKAKQCLEAAQRLTEQARKEDHTRLNLLSDSRAWRASALLSQVCRAAATEYRLDYEQHIQAATAELVA